MQPFDMFEGRARRLGWSLAQLANEWEVSAAEQDQRNIYETRFREGMAAAYAMASKMAHELADEIKLVE